MVLSVEIVLVVPPTIPMEVESPVQVRFTVCGGDGKRLRVVARLRDDVISTADIAATDTSTCILNIAAKSVGVIEIAAVTEEGLLLCTPAKLLVVQQEIAHEANQFGNLVVDVRDQAEVAAWCKHFHPLIQDLGVILRDPGCRDIKTEKTVCWVLTYLVRNQAYATAQFLLRLVAEHGVPILCRGKQIDANEIDIAAIDESGYVQ